MKLFTKDIDKKLFAQFEKGSDLENQMVVAKIFNPYGRGVWYILNSDPSDPDYLWAIVDLFDVEAGSVSRSELESIKVPPFRLPLERDMYFEPINAAELYRGLRAGKTYAEGGEISIEAQNKDMLINYAEELEHHIKEFEEAAKGAQKVMPWVIAKIERASTDLSDVTHYLASENEKRREYQDGEGEEEYADGGEVKWQDAHYGDNALVVSENKMGIIIKPYGRKFHLRFADGTEKTYDASELKFFKDIDEFDRGGEVKSYNAMYFKEITNRNGSKMEIMRDRTVFNGSLENVLSRAYSGFYPTDKYVVIKDREKDSIVARLNSDGKGEVFYDGYGINKGEIELEKEVEEVEEKPKKKLFGIFAEGGEVDGVDLFEDYENIPEKVQQILDNFADAFEDGDYKGLEKANKALLKIGYTFEYGLDGQAYDLRKVGEKGKSESYAKGGEITVKVGDKIKSKSGVEGEVYESTGMFFKLKDKYGNKGSKFYSTRDFKVSEIKSFADGGTPDPMATVNEISKISGLRPVAVAEWGDKNNINLSILLKDLKSKKIKGMDLMTAISGNPNNKYQKELLAKYSRTKMATGGKVKFADKVKSIKKSLLERKKVSPKVQKDYGKTYSPKEAEESAKRIVGAMTAKERLMAKRKKTKK